MIHFVMTLNAQFCISKTTAASTVTVPPKCRYLSTRLHHVMLQITVYHNSSIRHHDNLIHFPIQIPHITLTSASLMRSTCAAHPTS